jgi:hypothetical protein
MKERETEVLGKRALVGFSFGTTTETPSGNIHPGISNHELIFAVRAQDHRFLLEANLILQEELALALLDFECTGRRGKVYVICEHKEEGYLDTMEVARQAALIIQREGYDTIDLLAHPWHYPYARLCLDRALRERGLSLKIKRFKTGTISFDPDSKHPGTQSGIKFIIYVVLKIFFGHNANAAGNRIRGFPWGKKDIPPAKNKPQKL